VRRNRRKSLMGPMNPSSTMAIIANVIENETIETSGTLTFDADELRPVEFFLNQLIFTALKFVNILCLGRVFS
jgi:hypothetical protein